MKRYRNLCRRTAAMLLALLMLLLCACNKTPNNGGEASGETGSQAPVVTPPPTVEIDPLGNGVSFSIAGAEDENLDMESICSLMKTMNLQTVRVEVGFQELLNESGEVYSGSTARYNSWIRAMKQNGVENILFVVKGATWGSEYDVTDPNAYPYPDSEQNSQYTKFLELYKKSFASLAAAFPDVTWFQAGQDFNLEENAHPVRDRFSIRDKAALAVDLCYAARQGVRSVNPDAKVVFSGASAAEGTDTAINFFKQCFRYLSEGRSPYGVLKPSGCFDAISWSPSLNWYQFDVAAFVEQSNSIYGVLRENKAEMPVFLGNFGFCDYGSRTYDLKQGEWLTALVGAIGEQMPYVAASYPAWLLEAGKGSAEEAVYSGLFRVFGEASFGAKEKTKALCSIYQGVNGQLDQFIGNNLVYEDSQQGDLRHGIGFPVKGAEERGLNIEKIMDQLDVMNVQTLRNWMNIRTLLTSPTSINEHEVELQKKWIAQLNRRGITKIIGLSQGGFWPEPNVTQDESAVPYRDLEEGSLYLAYLAAYEQSWYTLASTFPEIQYWEVGNETNSDNFLHPITFVTQNKKFTSDEKALITADMCYTAAKAIRRANPNATVLFPGMAPISGFSSMETFLNKVYSFIEAGDCIGGTDPDAYFDAVAWHCYYFKTTFTPENWLEGNNSVYQVMVNHGDADKKVFITEFGFSDGGSQEKDALQASYFREIFALADQMPYVEGFYPFRTIEDETAAEWGGTIEIYYGMFRVFDQEHFGAKEKAKVLCELYGGDLTKLDQYSGGMSVYPR